MKNIVEKKMRLSNFELLRIICILLIVAHHFSVHSNPITNETNFNLYLHSALATGGKIAVNIFILISGYFMIDSNFKFKKLLKLIFQTLFYTILIYLGLCIFKYETFNISTLIQQFFPISNKLYWFMTSYILLYILSPFLNKLLKCCSKKEHIILLTLLLVLQTNFFDLNNPFNLGDLSWFITLYISSALVKIHYNELRLNSYIISFYILSLVTMILLYAFLEVNMWSINHILCYFISITTFIIFKNLKIKESKMINLVSSTTLGVYLLHDNNFIRELLWNKWLDVPYHFQRGDFWLFSIISILVVFIICSAIDYIRI